MIRGGISKAAQVFRKEGLGSLLLKTLSLSRNYVLDMISIRSLKEEKNLGEIVEQTLALRVVFAIQKKEEITKFLKVVQQEPPCRVLEIGTACGGTLFLLARAATEDATIISLDLPEGMFGGGYPEYKLPLYRSFASTKQHLHLVRADSHDENSLARVREILSGHLLDLLFIDGDHSYEGVKADFAMYRGLVRDGGIIAFHDIVPGDVSRVGGVHRFWNEIKSGYLYEEVVDSWDQGGYGIGWLRYHR